MPSFGPAGLIRVQINVPDGEMTRDSDSLPISRGRWRAAVFVAVCLLAAGGCSTHHAAATRSCGSITRQRVVVVSNRGAMGLAKIGLSPKVLKAQQNCS
jgi:hypothetical protein